MYNVKSKIFLTLSKTQKSAVCHFARALVKKLPNLSSQEILDKFIDDERYYLELNSSRFPFLEDFIEEEDFSNDLLLYIKECRKYYDYKKSQQPLIDAQKQFEKKKRAFLQEIKMSKEPPSKKQLSYYRSLCKRFNKERQDSTGLSKLDLKRLIEGMIDEHSNTDSN